MRSTIPALTFDTDDTCDTKLKKGEFYYIIGVGDLY